MSRGRKPAPEVEIEVPDIRRVPLEMGLTCGSCLYLHRYAAYPLPCDKYGTLSSSIPCRRFVPDPALLGSARSTRDALEAIGRADNPQLLTAVMHQSRRLRKHGLHVGDVVFFRVCGEDYLCNYAFGVVTGAERTALIIMGAHGFVARLGLTDIMRRHEWETLRNRLVQRDRINQPSGGLRRITLKGRERLIAYEPPPAGGTTRRKKPTSKGPRSSFSGKKTAIVTLSGEQNL